MKQYLHRFKKALVSLKEATQKTTYAPAYRVLEILKDEEDNYSVHIQLIGKSATFYAKPEEILAEDGLVDLFSPRDIRTLTYLGYLGVNAPKYKLLAKRLVEDNHIVFAIKKRGEKEILVKTSAQIFKEHEIIENMHPKDAETVGYAMAVESLQQEKKIKDTLLKQLQKDHSEE